MTTDVIVTAHGADSLTCPFTGERLEVHMIVNPGSIVFCAPSAFTLAEPVERIDELYERATMRNGVSGLADRASPVDPYTGEPLTLREYPDGRVSLVGGFNPRTACDSLDRFVYLASQRDGRTDVMPPEEFTAESVAATRPRRHKDFDVGQDTLDAAEAAVDRAGLVKKSVRGASIGRKRDV